MEIGEQGPRKRSKFFSCSSCSAVPEAEVPPIRPPPHCTDPQQAADGSWSHTASIPWEAVWDQRE